MTRAARALIGLVDHPVGTCSSCRMDFTAVGGLNRPSRFVDFRMTVVPVGDEQLFLKRTLLNEEVDELHLCESCIQTAARTLGLLRDASDDPEVQRLMEARAVMVARQERAQLDEADARQRLREAEAR